LEGEVKKYKFDCDKSIYIGNGGRMTPLQDFLYHNPPLIYYVDGSFQEGNQYTEITHVVPLFEKSKVIPVSWGSTNIRKESQTYLRKADSIQYHLIESLKAREQYSIIMDDDDKGEIADVVAFEVNHKNHTLTIDLFHCKYAIDGT